MNNTFTFLSIGAAAIAGFLIGASWLWRKKSSQRENALKENKQALELAMQTMRITVWVWDLKHDSVTVLPNAIHEEIPRANRKKLQTSEVFFGCIHEDDRSRVLKALQSLSPQKTSLTEEARYRETSEQEEWMTIHAQLIFDSEKRAGKILGITQNTTASKNSAAALLQSEQLAAIAHEINNPIAGIKNSFALIRESIPLNHPRRPFVALIDREVERVSRIVLRMFDLYRAKTPMPHEFSVQSVINDAVSILHSRAFQRGISIRLYMPSYSVNAFLIESHLAQIMINLLDNAIDASPQNSEIQVRLSGDENRVLIGVCDNGNGMSNDVKARMFEPFFSTKSEKSGLGLGLAITRNLVEDLGGWIRCDTVIGRGSQFWVQLPRRQSAPTAPVEKPEPLSLDVI